MARSAPQVAAYYHAGPSMSALAAAIEAAATERDDFRGTAHERQLARTLNHMLLDVRLAMEPHLNDLAEKEALAEAAEEAANEAAEAADEADWERRFPTAANDMAPRRSQAQRGPRPLGHPQQGYRGAPGLDRAGRARNPADQRGPARAEGRVSRRRPQQRSRLMRPFLRFCAWDLPVLAVVILGLHGVLVLVGAVR